MRTHGKLTKWNKQRGFGFIEAATGGAEIFVHVTAFPRDGIHPRIGELISFEIDQRGDGKLRAVRVMRPGGSDLLRQRSPVQPSSTWRAPLASLASLASLQPLAGMATRRSVPATSSRTLSPRNALPSCNAQLQPPRLLPVMVGRIAHR